MFCSNCGTQLTEDARFCFRCGAPAMTPAAPVVEEPTAQVRMWRGYLSAEFYVELDDADAGGIRVERSRPFRWRKDEPPPRDRDDVLEAYDGLVSRLHVLGWEQVGVRSPWYAQRFRRGAEPLEAQPPEPGSGRLRDVSQEGS